MSKISVPFIDKYFCLKQETFSLASLWKSDTFLMQISPDVCVPETRPPERANFNAELCVATIAGLKQVSSHI